jgi:hypothetical protein
VIPSFAPIASKIFDGAMVDPDCHASVTIGTSSVTKEAKRIFERV